MCEGAQVYLGFSHMIRLALDGQPKIETVGVNGENIMELIIYYRYWPCVW